ncbi:YabP/YqfC family sporulation protein [Bacillota bacterium Meth-B3]
MSRTQRARSAFPALEWIEEATGQQPRLLLAGGRRAMIENLTGIIEFTDQRIRLMTRAGALTLTGRGLLLTQVRPDALTVRGCITKIELPGGGEDHG